MGVTLLHIRTLHHKDFTWCNVIEREICYGSYWFFLESYPRTCLMFDEKKGSRDTLKSKKLTLAGQWLAWRSLSIRLEPECFLFFVGRKAVKFRKYWVYKCRNQFCWYKMLQCIEFEPNLQIRSIYLILSIKWYRNRTQILSSPTSPTIKLATVDYLASLLTFQNHKFQSSQKCKQRRFWQWQWLFMHLSIHPSKYI